MCHEHLVNTSGLEHEIDCCNLHNLQHVGYIGMVGPVGYGHSQLQYIEQHIPVPELLRATIHLDLLLSLQQNPGEIT